LHYQWLKDGTPIANAADINTFMPLLTDEGSQISCRVTKIGTTGSIDSLAYTVNYAFITGVLTIIGMDRIGALYT